MEEVVRMEKEDVFSKRVIQMENEVRRKRTFFQWVSPKWRTR